MSRIWVTVLALWALSPAPARAEKESKKPPPAQEGGFGLDLTQDADKGAASEPGQPASESLVPPSLTAAEKRAESEDLLVERDVTKEDRVKSVQRKVYLKRHRFELAPFVSVSLNDPYYLKLAATLRGAYYFADTLALALRGSVFQVLPTEDVRTAKRTFQSRIFFSVPNWMAMLDFEWSPIYGKITIFNSILHFDAYLLGGLGMVVTDTSAVPGRPAADLGIGLRFVVTDFLAVNAGVTNTGYVDTPTGITKGNTQNLLMLNAGISLFFPFRSTGREAE